MCRWVETTVASDDGDADEADCATEVRKQVGCSRKVVDWFHSHIMLPLLSRGNLSNRSMVQMNRPKRISCGFSQIFVPAWRLMRMLISQKRANDMHVEFPKQGPRLRMDNMDREYKRHEETYRAKAATKGDANAAFL